MTLDRLHDEPCFSVTMRGAAIEATGPTRFFRGHTLDSTTRDDRPDGIFAEWSWDGRRLTVRTDRYGVAPLFYFHDGSRFAVSPSIVRLVDAGAPTRFDESALAVFVRLGFFVGDDTPFRSIRAVPPDGTLTWDAGTVSVTGGYRLPETQRFSRREAIDGFIDLFRQAMRRRPGVEHDIVVPLSGGRDSRHILLELCANGHPPDLTVTIPRFPPRASEDERLAPIVARELRVRHRLLEQRDASFPSEYRKNWETHLCADEHAWYVAMVDQIAATARTVYDGLGGALSVPNRFLSPEALALFERAEFHALARRLLASNSRSTEALFERVLNRGWYAALSLEHAVDRLAAELARHRDAADPVKSFNFWNRIRRELALQPYGLMKSVPTIYSPYLDHELYDFLSSLPPEVMSPTLSASDKSFHTDAILRGYPRFAHIPFEDKAAARRDARAHDARFVRDTARCLLPRAATRTTLLNRLYVLPRLAYSLARRSYREAIGWLPIVALYLFQLDAVADRRHGAVDFA
jgi:hypothetical protein